MLKYGVHHTLISNSVVSDTLLSGARKRNGNGRNKLTLSLFAEMTRPLFHLSIVTRARQARDDYSAGLRPCRDLEARAWRSLPLLRRGDSHTMADQRRIHLPRDDGLPPYILQIYPASLRAGHHGLQVPLRSQDRQDPRSWSKHRR